MQPCASNNCSPSLLTFADSCDIPVEPGLAAREAKSMHGSFCRLVRLQHLLWRPAPQALRGRQAQAGAAGRVATCEQVRRAVRAAAWGQLSHRDRQGPITTQTWASREHERGENTGLSLPVHPSLRFCIAVDGLKLQEQTPCSNSCAKESIPWRDGVLYFLWWNSHFGKKYFSLPKITALFSNKVDKVGRKPWYRATGSQISFNFWNCRDDHNLTRTDSKKWQSGGLVGSLNSSPEFSGFPSLQNWP